MAVAVLVSTVTGGGVASAAEGPAPVPAELRVLDTEHTDTVSTFWDDGDFVLGTKADVDGGLGVRFPADGTLVHISDLARMDNWPAGYEFVAPAGSSVWLAPMTQQAGIVWPGFSTESVPPGVLNGSITFTLDAVAGPGTMEMWTTDSFGGVQERLWSSDEPVKSFARPINIHMHANWAFTQPGTYKITVTASALTVGGAAVSDTKTYTFVAGPLPEVVSTATSLHVTGGATVTSGTPVGLQATVSPASVEGYVEFRDGATVLGHEPVAGGAAFEAAGLSIGSHSITAHFFPKVANFTTGSASAPVTVTVTPAQVFPDVPVSSPFFTAISWAADVGITNGYADGTFRPVAPIARDAVAAMLFRAFNPGAAKPLCGPGQSPFTDVPRTHQFCGESAWLKAEGLTNGYADGTYRPAQSIARDAMAAFMARAYGPATLPACGSPRPFSDVGPTHQFCKEILWLKTANITTGFTDGTFRPALPIERQAFVTFLYRAEH